MAFQMFQKLLGNFSALTLGYILKFEVAGIMYPHAG